MGKVKVTDPFEDNVNWEDGKCAVCKGCRIFKRTGQCLYGGPFRGYAKVVYEKDK